MDTPLQNLAVIGAGAMGSGIAALFALKGLDVVLVDPMEGALDRARAVILLNARQQDAAQCHVKSLITARARGDQAG